MTPSGIQFIVFTVQCAGNGMRKMPGLKNVISRAQSLALMWTITLNPVDLPRGRTVEPQDAHYRRCSLGGASPPPLVSRHSRLKTRLQKEI